MGAGGGGKQRRNQTKREFPGRTRAKPQQSKERGETKTVAKGKGFFLSFFRPLFSISTKLAAF